MSVDFHNGIREHQEFGLRGALLFYHGDTGSLVTVNQIEEAEEGGKEILAGLPFSQEQVSAFVRGVQGLVPTRTVFPPNLLCWDGRRLAWWLPSARRRIWFDGRQQPGLQDVSRKEVLHPPLVFIADPGQLYLYALAQNERPDADTPLFQAPYLNVYDDGSLCAGWVEFPRNAEVGDTAKWELLFFDSEGTHAAASKLTLYPGGHDALWRAMRTADAFPVESLVPTGLTLWDAINREGPPATGYPVQEEIVPAPAPALEEAA